MPPSLICALAAAGALVVVSSGCDGDESRSDRGAVPVVPATTATETTWYAPPWGREAEDAFQILDEVLDDRDAIGVAGFYSGATLDLSAWGGRAASSAPEVVTQLRRLWFMVPWAPRPAFDPDVVFLGADSAVVQWVARTGTREEIWLQRFDFVDGTLTASRVFPVEGSVPADTRDEVAQLHDRYLALWSSGEPTQAMIDTVYAPGAVVVDASSGSEQPVHQAPTQPATAPQPTAHPVPDLYVYGGGDHVEAIALVERGGACAVLEARHWLVDDGRIVRETTYPDIASVRRCGQRGGDGWWTRYEAPPPLDRVMVDEVGIGGSSVELVNGEPTHTSFIGWLLEQFRAGGLDRPDVAAVRFPPAGACDDYAGEATQQDAGYDRSHTIVLCFGAAQLYPVDGSAGWSPTAVTYGLHELAHVWMFDHLDDRAQQQFMERGGFDVWSGDGTGWSDRGVEHAAATLAWGLAGDDLARMTIPPAPPCAELAVRYELLVGRPPITSCPADG